MFSLISESVGEILQEVGRDFLLLNWVRGSFSRKNIVSSLLILQLSLFPYHSKHPIQTVLLSVLKQSKNFVDIIHPLLCPYAIKSNTHECKNTISGPEVHIQKPLAP